MAYSLHVSVPALLAALTCVPEDEYMENNEKKACNMLLSQLNLKKVKR